MRCERRAEVVEEALKTERIGSGVVVRAYQFSRKSAQHKERFVGQSRTADNPDRISTVTIRDRVETLRDVTNSFIPRCRNQLAAFLVTDHRRANALFVIDERMAEASLHTEKLAIETVDITIARD